MAHVYSKVSRLEKRYVAAYENLGSATVYEASGRKGSVDPAIKPLVRGVRICGTAITVQCHPRDNLMLHKSLQLAQEGDILVADTLGYPNAGYWGGLMTDSALARKLGGLAIDGCIRDSAEIVSKGFPVFCRGTCIRGTTKGTLGSVNHPIMFGGVMVMPGDLVLGDDDGIVIVSRDDLDKVLEASLKRMDNEKEKSEALSRGVSSVELNKLQKVFDSLGLVEE